MAAAVASSSGQRLRSTVKAEAPIIAGVAYIVLWLGGGGNHADHQRRVHKVARTEQDRARWVWGWGGEGLGGEHNSECGASNRPTHGHSRVQNSRRLAAEHVADDPSEGGGDEAACDAHKRCAPLCECYLGTDDSERTKASANCAASSSSSSAKT